MFNLNWHNTVMGLIFIHHPCRAQCGDGRLCWCLMLLCRCIPAMHMCDWSASEGSSLGSCMHACTDNIRLRDSQSQTEDKHSSTFNELNSTHSFCNHQLVWTSVQRAGCLIQRELYWAIFSCKMVSNEVNVQLSLWCSVKQRDPEPVNHRPASCVYVFALLLNRSKGLRLICTCIAGMCHLQNTHKPTHTHTLSTHLLTWWLVSKWKQAFIWHPELSAHAKTQLRLCVCIHARVIVMVLQQQSV